MATVGEQMGTRITASAQYSAAGDHYETGEILVCWALDQCEIYSPHGFKLEPFCRIDSALLRATGSKMFIAFLDSAEKAKLPTNDSELLIGFLSSRKSYTIQALRTINKHSLGERLGKAIPDGIKFVLNLTPLDEGQVAQLLFSELCLSRGILLWYTSEYRLGVSSEIVDVKDETASPHSYTGPNALIDRCDCEKESVIDPRLRSLVFNNDGDKDGFSFTDMKKALEESARDCDIHSKSTRTYNHLDGDTNVPEAYCAIRLRAAIERLIHMIAGGDRNYDLDSAPKVFYLAKIANYFQCTTVVSDDISTWLLNGKNSQIIETFPEYTLQLGFDIQSSTIARPSFAILVAEEAFCPGSVIESTGAKTVHFERTKGSVDDDLVGLIQFAAKDFSDRVNNIVERLIDREMLWMKGLEEYQKIIAHVKAVEGNFTIIINLVMYLRRLVRGRILSYFVADLNSEGASGGDLRRRKTLWDGEWIQNMWSVYGKMAPKDRIFTKVFWQHLTLIDLNLDRSH